MAKRGLGKGLEALFSQDESSTNESNQLKIEKIIARKDQPRKTFKEEALKELAESIKEHGILQPLLVRPYKDDLYELIAGERRYRAAIILGLEEVPVVVKEMEDNTVMEAALIENLQREDLSPVEEAFAFKEMIEKYSYTQEQLAAKIGKSRAYIANAVRILNLPEEILLMVEDGRLSAGHARAILSVKDKGQQMKLASKIVESGLSVRESEGAGKKKTTDSKDVNLVELEDRLQDKLGTRVRLNKKGRGGKIEIAFFDDEDLQRIMEILGISL